MTETVTVRMSRSDANTVWGFQIQGGSDYNAPISIGAVQKGSLADRAGLHTGDVVSTLCGRPAGSMSHKDAQDTIVRNTTSVDLVVQRQGGGAQRYWSTNQSSASTYQSGGGTHIQTQQYRHSASSVPAASSAPLKIETQAPPPPKPAPPPAQPPPQPRPQPAPAPVVSVSLEDNRETANIPGFNRSAQPYQYAVRTGEVLSTTQAGGIKSTHDLQYNCPRDIYSDKATTDEYLRATGGCFGTDPNLFKPEKPKGDIERSAVLALIREEEAERGRSPAPRGASPAPPQYRQQQRFQESNAQDDLLIDPVTGRAHFDSDSRQPPSAMTGGRNGKGPISDRQLRKLRAKNGETIHSAIQRLEDMYNADYQRYQSEPQFEAPAPGGPVCDHCGRAIIGVFCNAGGKTLHADCFKCSTCGSSLKDVGFFNVGGKLYCDVHAAQRQGNLFGPRPPQPPDTFLPRGYLPDQPKRSSTPTKAFYQPEILTRGPVSPLPPQQQQQQRIITQTRQVNVGGGLSPQSRGVPTHKPITTVHGSQDYSGAVSRITIGGGNYGGGGRQPDSASGADTGQSGSSTATTGGRLPYSAWAGVPRQPEQRSTSVPILKSPPSGSGGGGVTWNQHHQLGYWPPASSSVTSPSQSARLYGGDGGGVTVPYWSVGSLQSPRYKSPTPISYDYERAARPQLVHYEVHLNNSNAALDAYQTRINQLRLDLRDRQHRQSTSTSSTTTTVSADDNHSASGGGGAETPHTPTATPEDDGVPLLSPGPPQQLDLSKAINELNINIDSLVSSVDTVDYLTAPSSQHSQITPSSTHSSSSLPSPAPAIPPDDYNYLSTISEERSSVEDLRPSPHPTAPRNNNIGALKSIFSRVKEEDEEGGGGGSSSANSQELLTKIPRPSSQERELRVSDTEPDMAVTGQNNQRVTTTSSSAGGGGVAKQLTKQSAVKDGVDPDQARMDTNHLTADPSSLLESPEFAAFAEKMSVGAIKDATFTVDLEETLSSMNALAAEFEAEAARLERVMREEEQRRLTTECGGNAAVEQQVDEALVTAENLLHSLAAAKSSSVEPSTSKESDYPGAFQTQQNYAQPPAPAPAPVYAPPPAPAPVYAPPPAPAPVYAPPPAPAPAPAPVQAPFSAGPPPPSAPIGGGTSGSASSAPLRGRGVLKQLTDLPRTPYCQDCKREIRGPFILAMNKTWCPEHFTCAGSGCGRKLLDVGFVEEQGRIYCEYCFEQHFAPKCAACSKAITGDCLNALDKHWHPDCFCCAHCRQPFGNASFFLEDGKPYCERDWNAQFTTKCVSCKFPIEAGDRWVEALGNAYHSDCFTCSYCHCNLEGQSFYAKGGHPYCKAHA